MCVQEALRQLQTNQLLNLPACYWQISGKTLNVKRRGAGAAPSTCPTVGSRSPIPRGHVSGPQTPPGFVLPPEEQRCPASASHREKPKVGA